MSKNDYQLKLEVYKDLTAHIEAYKRAKAITEIDGDTENPLLYSNRYNIELLYNLLERAGLDQEFDCYYEAINGEPHGINDTEREYYNIGACRA